MKLEILQQFGLYVLKMDKIIFSDKKLLVFGCGDNHNKLS